MINFIDHTLFLSLLGVEHRDGEGIRQIDGRTILQLRWLLGHDDDDEPVTVVDIYRQLAQLETDGILIFLNATTTAYEELIADVCFTPYGEALAIILMHERERDHDL